MNLKAVLTGIALLSSVAFGASGQAAFGASGQAALGSRVEIVADPRAESRVVSSVQSTIPLPNPLTLLERYEPNQPTPQSKAQAGQTWTVLVYLHADHNLWSNALFDLLEMQQIGSSAGVRFVVQIDAPPPGSEAAKGFDSFNGGVRALVTRNQTSGYSKATLNASVGKLQLLERLGEQNSDDPRVLAEFINWGVSRFPAQRYGLVMWDHGGAWQGGFGGDSSNGDEGMATWEVRQGIQAGLAQSGLTRFDFFGMDTCLMGGVELLYEYGDLTQLYIGNPEIDYGDGWDYAAVFNLLTRNPNISNREFARSESGFFDAHHQESPSDIGYRAHAGYDTGQLENLRGAINAFVTAATQSSDRAALLSARSSVVEYLFSASKPNAPRPYVDIGHYAQLVARLTKDSRLASAGNALSAAVAQTVIAKSLGSNLKAAFGLGIWLPNNPAAKPSAGELGAYATRLRMASLLNWKTFIDLWFGNIAPTVTQNNQGVQVRVTRKVNLREPTVRDPAVIGFEVTGNVNLVYGELGEAVGRNGFNSYGHLYLQPGSAGQYEYPWDGQWFDVIGAENSSDFFTGFYQRGGDNAIYATAEYTPPGRTQSYSVIVVGNLSTARLTNVLDNSSIAPRDITLRAGGTLRFQFLQRDLLTDDTLLVPTGRSVKIPEAGLESMRLERKRMPLGDYQLIFGARDAAGNLRSGNAPVQIR